MEVKILEVGDYVHTKYHRRKIAGITDTKILISEPTNREYDIDVIRDINVSILQSECSNMVKLLEKYEDEYKFILCDMHGNIAVSKIPQGDYNTEAEQAKQYKVFYDEHVKFLYMTEKFKLEHDDAVGDILHPVITKYISLLGLFMWNGLTTHDFAMLIDSMYSFGDKFSEEPSKIYENTIFKKSK